LSRNPLSRISKRTTVRARKSHNSQEFIMKIVRRRWPERRSPAT
jgi:hypothetical protein